VRPEGLGKFKISPHRVSKPRPSDLWSSASTTRLPRTPNLYIYIQEIGVRIGCYGLGRGTHYCPPVVIRVKSLVRRGGIILISKT
jgi:hypothetical protein